MSEVWITVGELLAALALVLANGFFVAAEFSLVSVRRTRIDELVAQGTLGAKAVQRAHRNIDIYIAATQLGVTLASLALGWLGEPTVAHVLEGAFGRAPGGETLAVIIAFTAITSFHIVLGELVPKTLALRYTERVVLLTIQPLTIFQFTFHVFIISLSRAGRSLLGLLGLHAPAGHELVHSAEELKMLVEASGRAGALEDSEREIINRAFDFADTAVREVMVPRTEMVGVEADLGGTELLRFVKDAGYSRYPVYEGSLDQVAGIMHVKDLLAAVLDDRLATTHARDLARTPLWVPETRSVDEMLADMREQNQRMALVFDEFSGTAGLVTMENVLERLVGDVSDEFEREAPPDIERLPDGTTAISGLMLISEVNEQFGLGLDDAEFDTIGGYIFGSLGRLPESGDLVHVQDFDLVVEAMDGRRVDRVRLIPAVTSTEHRAPSNE